MIRRDPVLISAVTAMPGERLTIFPRPAIFVRSTGSAPVGQFLALGFAGAPPGFSFDFVARASRTIESDEMLSTFPCSTRIW